MRMGVTTNSRWIFSALNAAAPPMSSLMSKMASSFAPVAMKARFIHSSIVC